MRTPFISYSFQETGTRTSLDIIAQLRLKTLWNHVLEHRDKPPTNCTVSNTTVSETQGQVRFLDKRLQGKKTAPTHHLIRDDRTTDFLKHRKTEEKWGFCW